MKQYCRYCIHLVTGNGIYCQAKEFTMPESTAKGANTCKLFEFCEEDAFGETKGYKPRERRSGSEKEEMQGEQMQLIMED